MRQRVILFAIHDTKLLRIVDFKTNIILLIWGSFKNKVWKFIYIYQIVNNLIFQYAAILDSLFLIFPPYCLGKGLVDLTYRFVMHTCKLFKLRHFLCAMACTQYQYTIVDDPV